MFAFKFGIYNFIDSPLVLNFRWVYHLCIQLKTNSFFPLLLSNRAYLGVLDIIHTPSLPLAKLGILLVQARWAFVLVLFPCRPVKFLPFFPVSLLSEKITVLVVSTSQTAPLLVRFLALSFRVSRPCDVENELWESVEPYTAW